MHIEIHGRRDADAPTLVFSSGLGGAAHFWMPQLDALTSDYRVVLYDQLGTGKSPAALPADYSIHAMASELRTLLASHGIGDYHLIGLVTSVLFSLTVMVHQVHSVQSMIKLQMLMKKRGISLIQTEQLLVEHQQ